MEDDRQASRHQAQLRREGLQTAVICTQECFGDCQRVGRRHGLLAYVQSPDKKDAHMSSFSATSAPMRSRVQAQAQMVLSGSWWISRRGKCAGSAWRLGCCFSRCAAAPSRGPPTHDSRSIAAKSASMVCSRRLFCSTLKASDLAATFNRLSTAISSLSLSMAAACTRSRGRRFRACRLQPLSAGRRPSRAVAARPGGQGPPCRSRKVMVPQRAGHAPQLRRSAATTVRARVH